MAHERDIVFIDLIELETVRELVKRVHELFRGDPERPIHLYLSSTGGLARASQAFFDFVCLKGIPLETHAIGFVDSAALVLYAAGKVRWATTNATFYFHAPNKMFERQKMSLVDLEREAMEGRLTHDRSEEILAGVCNCPLQRIQKLSLETRTLGAHEAIDLGLVHKLEPA